MVIRKLLLRIGLFIGMTISSYSVACNSATSLGFIAFGATVYGFKEVFKCCTSFFRSDSQNVNVQTLPEVHIYKMRPKRSKKPPRMLYSVKVDNNDKK